MEDSFVYLLKEANSTHRRLVVYNSVRWLTRGHFLERSVYTEFD